MIINDDILNKYLDGEMSQGEAEEIEKQLSAFPVIEKRLSDLRKADAMFRKMKEESVTADFTSAVMAKLQKKKSSFRSSQYFFFYFIAGLLALSCTGFFIYILSGIFASPGDMSDSAEVSKYVNTFADTLLHYTKIIFNQQNFALIGSLAAVTLLVSGYFFFENLKQYKRITK